MSKLNHQTFNRASSDFSDHHRCQSTTELSLRASNLGRTIDDPSRPVMSSVPAAPSAGPGAAAGAGAGGESWPLAVARLRLVRRRRLLRPPSPWTAPTPTAPSASSGRPLAPVSLAGGDQGGITTNPITSANAARAASNLCQTERRPPSTGAREGTL